MSTIELLHPDQPAPRITQAQALSHAWGERVLFSQLDLAIPSGVTLLHGDEQTGKTTLLWILAGELQPTGGALQTLGVNPAQQLDAYAPLVFRTDPLNAALDRTSPAQWLATLPERYPRFHADALTYLINGFALQPHMDKPLYMLSAGSRRKVWLSAAMASGAVLTLIDQPFAALDTPSARLLLEVLQDFAQSSNRACVLADYEAPMGVRLAGTIAL